MYQKPACLADCSCQIMRIAAIREHDLDTGPAVGNAFKAMDITWLVGVYRYKMLLPFMPSMPQIPRQMRL